MPDPSCRSFRGPFVRSLMIGALTWSGSLDHLPLSDGPGHSLSPASASAAETVPGSAGLQPKHIAQIRTVVEAVASPDGHSIAYTLSIPRKPLEDENGPAWVELHVSNGANSSRPFITGKVNIRSVQWTQDGKRILYLARRADDKHANLYAIPIDGGESQLLLKHSTGIGDYSVHPDGKQIAFLAEDERPKDREELQSKGFNQQIYEEDSPRTFVWISSSPEQPARKLDLAGSASYVEWSPNGHDLLVVLAPSPSVDDSYMFKRLYVVDGTNGQIVETIKNPGKLGEAHWSPDGKSIAFVSGADLNDPSEGRLLLASIPGGEIRDLLPSLEAHVTSISWQDASHLIWLAEDHEESTLGRTAIDGSTTQLVARTGPVFTHLSLASQQPLAGLVGQTPEHPPEVYLFNLGDHQSSRWTNSNPWLSEIKLAKQETVQWTARDGQSLSGVVIRPLNYVEGRRYPMIMVVHGGPESSVPNGWVTTYSNPGQMAAARGFVVFYPNYRGSTGRGVEFSKLGQGDAAGKEFDDLIDGIDHLANQGLIDPAKVGITGGSYGGYASAWGATYYSDRFAASVMFVGISDNVSKVGTTDIPEEMYLVHHRKRLWDDWNYFAQRSPIYYVQRNKTPTLILHGKVDPRVHPSQSLELHRHLKTLNQAPVRLVLYEGEGHGNRQAASRFDYSLRLLQWMEHYLQGPGGAAPPYELDYEAALK